MIKGAIIDETGKYRYSLWRIWDEAKPLVVFVMLNPSTADAEEDDPTIRRCMNYARDWGCGGIEVVNLFAYRATDPKELAKVADPVGPLNQKHILQALQDAGEKGIIIAAWGAAGIGLNRTRAIANYLKLVPEIQCLAVTKYGHPKHPLYLRADLKPRRWPA